MSTSDKFLLILHLGFVIFTLGPLTAATMASPRYIRRGDARVLRYLNRITRLYGLLALGVVLFGLLLARFDLTEVYLSASTTLFIVGLVLLFIVERDQRKAVHLVREAVAAGRLDELETPAPPDKPDKPDKSDKTDAPGSKDEGGSDKGQDKGENEKERPRAPRPDIAPVERGRIAAISGVVALIWLVILVLMVWND